MKKKSNKVWYILGTLVAAAIIFAVVAKKQGWIGKEELTEVTTEKAKRTDIIERVSASGKIQPEIEVKISPDVSGEIIDLKLVEGDSVRKGQFLLRIRPDNYKSMLDRANASLSSSRATATQTQAAYAQSEARLNRAKLNYDRNVRLHDQKVISDADFEQIKSDYDVAVQDLESQKQNIQAARFSAQSAEASVKDASENLRKTEIYAPVTGTISKLNVEKGERVVGTAQMTGTEIMRIADLHEMEVLVDVNENDIVRVQVGDTADIDVDSYTGQGRKFKGMVTSIANTAKTTTATDAVTEFEVKVRILRESYQDLVKKGSDSPFRPGMSASVDIITNRKSNVLTVPLAAVTMRSLKDDNAPKSNEAKANNDDAKPTVRDDKENKKDELKEVVFVLKDGKAVRTPVTTGISDFDNIEILSGISESDVVISGPFLTVSKKLKNKEAVTVKKDEEKAAKKKGVSVTVN